MQWKETVVKTCRQILDMKIKMLLGGSQESKESAVQETRPLFAMARIDGTNIFVKKQRLLLDAEESTDFPQGQGVWDGVSRQVLVELLTVYADTTADVGDTAKISAFAAKVRRKLGMQ